MLGTSLVSLPHFKGVCCISFLDVFLYAHNRDGMLSSKSSFMELHTLVNAFSNTLLNTSTNPFSYGWYKVLV